MVEDYSNWLEEAITTPDEPEVPTPEPKYSKWATGAVIINMGAD